MFLLFHSLKYCHVIEWLSTGFGLVIGFTENLQIVTRSNYSAIANSHIVQFLSVGCIFTGCRLVTASNAVASSASVFTFLLAGDCLTTDFYLLTAFLRLSRNRSCSSLYSLGMDRIENTSSNSSNNIASRSYSTDRLENAASQLLHCCVLQICCGLYLTTAFGLSTTTRHLSITMTSRLRGRNTYYQPDNFVRPYRRILSPCPYTSSWNDTEDNG
jgi:hypothetical protein